MLATCLKDGRPDGAANEGSSDGGRSASPDYAVAGGVRIALTASGVAAAQQPESGARRRSSPKAASIAGALSVTPSLRHLRFKTMPTQIFVNLPVKNLNASVQFFTKLGYKFNSQFTDDTATCMIVSDNIYVMLLTEQKFRTFTPKAIADARQSTEVLVCLSCDSRAQVEDMVRTAIEAGGST